MAMKLAGTIAAVLTPLNDDLSPDTAEHVAHCRRLLEEGCDGLSPLGTSGESMSFTVAERKAILEALLDGGVAPDLLLPGTAAASYVDTVEITRHALSVGITSVLMLPPFYYKAVNEEGLYDAFARIIDGVGDDRLRVVLYHIPPVAVVPIGHGLVGRLRQAYPGIVAGVKDSSGDFANMIGYVDRFPGFAVLSGGEHLVKPLLDYGGAGSITGCSNVLAPDVAFVTRHHADPAKAAEVLAVHRKLARSRVAITSRPNISVLKALLARRTGKASWRNVRPPLSPLDDAAVQPIADTLAGL